MWGELKASAVFLAFVVIEDEPHIHQRQLEFQFLFYFPWKPHKTSSQTIKYLNKMYLKLLEMCKQSRAISQKNPMQSQEFQVL